MKNALTFSALVLALGMALPAMGQTLGRATFDYGQGEAVAQSAQLCPGDITLAVGESGIYSLEVFWDSTNTYPLTGNFFEIAATPEVSLSDYITNRGTWTVQEPQMGRLEAGTLNPGESYLLEVRITAAAPGNGTLTLTRGDDLRPTEQEQCLVTVEGLPPFLGAFKADQVNDTNGDGAANPGETITYTIGISNFGGGAANAVVFTDAANDHPNTMLIAGSVTTTRGQISSGNGVGDTDVRIDVGTIEGDGTQVAITFDVLIADPFPPTVSEVVNQGRFNGANFNELLTDDGDIPGAADPTVTPVTIPRRRLVIQSITPASIPTLDAGESVVYTITVVDENGAPVFGAVVDVDDALQGVIRTTMPTNEGGQTTYETVVQEGTADGRYALSFVARLSGFDDSDPLVRQIDVVNRVPGLVVEPIPVSFGQVLLGSTVERAVTIRNTGGALLTVDAVQITGIHAGDFTLPSLNLPLSIAPGGSTAVMIGFMPGLRGERSADLEVNSDGGNVTVPLTGEGVAPGISVAPDMLDYGLIDVGTSLDSTIIVTNTGTAALTILGVGLDGDDAAAFSVVSGAGQRVLAPGGTHPVVVRFTPQRAGAHSARVAIVNNATDDEGNLIGDVPVPLTGEGAVSGISAAPASIDYGLVDVGTSLDSTIIVTNTGTAALTILGVGLDGDDAAAFVIVSGRGQHVLAPGGTHAVVVRFAPQRAGAHSARIEVFNDARDDQGNPLGRVTVTLTGEGAVPGISAVPDRLDFGLISVGSSAADQFIVTNTGTAALTILGVGLDGDDAAAFVIVSGRGQHVVAPGGTHTVVVRFVPERTGAHSARIEVFNDARDDQGNLLGRVTVTLTGEGNEIVFTLEPPEAGPANAGEAVEIRVAIPDGFTPTTRQLFFRLGGETTYRNVDLQDDQGGLLGVIAADLVTERGLEYYVLLADDAVTLTYPDADPENNPLPLRVGVESLQALGSFQPEVYRMVSAPLVLPDSTILNLVDDYGPLDPTQWRVLRWRPGTEQYEEAPRDGPGPGFGPGKAAWLITRTGGGFDVNVGLSVDTSRPFVILLPPGWSQIATPFAFPVAVSSIATNGAIQGPYFYDGTEYLPNRPVLLPWEGYFVLNPGTTPVRFTVPPVESAGVSKHEGMDALFPEADFAVQLRAELIGYPWRDTQNYIGFAGASAAQPEAFNLAEPPPIGDHLRLSIVDDGQRYVSRFTPSRESGHQWDLEVEAVLQNENRFTPKTVRVVLVEQGPRPEGYDLYVFDRDLGRILPVESATFDVVLTPEHPVRHLSVVVGTASFADAHRDGASLAPVDFVLESNYPNPFNPETVIRYGLNQQSAVELAVYNVLGQRVRTLVATEQRSGQYEVVWDGLDDAGHPASSGIYMYQLRAGGFLASRTMLLVR